MPFRIKESIFSPCVSLTNEFSQSNEAGNQRDGWIRGKFFFGLLNGLKKMGFCSSTHPEWKDLFIWVKFYNSKIAMVGEDYDTLRTANGGILPYAIDSVEIIEKSGASERKATFMAELGQEYDFERGKHLILHDVLHCNIGEGDCWRHHPS